MILNGVQFAALTQRQTRLVWRLESLSDSRIFGTRIARCNLTAEINPKRFFQGLEASSEV